MKSSDNTLVSLNPGENTTSLADSTITQQTSPIPPINAGTNSSQPITSLTQGVNTSTQLTSLIPTLGSNEQQSTSDISELDLLNEILGTSGKDEIIGTDGDDWIQGFQGKDILFGKEGNDKLDGGLGTDELDGGSGNDHLLGDNGRDTLIGGEGDDILVGGLGGDTLTGGLGRDSFVYEQFNDGLDVITGFSVSEDWLDLTALFTKLDYTGSDPIADKYLNFEAYDNGVVKGTLVQFDSDGASGDMPFFNLAFLQNVSQADLKVSSDSASGNIIF